MIRRALVPLAILLAGCTHAPGPFQAGIASGAMSVQSRAAHAKKAPTGTSEGLPERLHQLFRANFDALDANQDGALDASDVSAAATKFHQVLGKYDANHDGALTPDEYFSPLRAQALMVSIQARATVSALAVGGHVTLDKMRLAFGVYLQDRIPEKADREKAMADAFNQADADHSHMLSALELQDALAILEAGAELHQIRHQLGIVAPLPAASAAPSPAN